MNINEMIANNKIYIEDTNGEFIFFLYDQEELIYIGRSSKRFPNLDNHKDKFFTHMSFIDLKQLDGSISYEELFFKLIFEYVPRYNMTLPANDRYMSKGMIKKRFDINGVELNRLIRKNNALPIFREYYDIHDVFQYND